MVADTLGLPELIIGWQDLQKWGILRLDEREVPEDQDGGIFAIIQEA